MNKLFNIICAIALISGMAAGLYGCGDNNMGIEEGTPMLEVNIGLITNESCAFTFSAINSDHICMLPSTGSASPAPQEVADRGTRIDGQRDGGWLKGRYTLEGLETDTDYVLHFCGISPSGKPGTLVSIGIRTLNEGKYYWEKERTSLPELADMTLCYGGSAHRKGYTYFKDYRWSKERFAPHVSYIDPTGKEQWLFESYLALEFVDTDAKMTFCYGDTQNRESATKECWMKLIDYWFEEGYGFNALEACIEEVKGRIGAPKSKRYVVMNLPDPIVYKYWKNTSSTTKYWGDLGNGMLDFSKAEDRLAALQWYINEVRKRFAQKNYQNIELVGFYIISEDIAVYHNGERYGWSHELKNNEQIFPAISRYLHAMNEGLYWIPYYDAGGYTLWKSVFEIDFAVMQPNHFWDLENKKPLARFFTMIEQSGMGMELELDDELLGSSPEALKYKEQFRDYLRWAKEKGTYGTKPFALYAGHDTVNLIARSSDESDRQIYRELCEFIIENPIKKY